MATIILDLPLVTSTFLFGGGATATAAFTTTDGVIIEYGPDLQIEYRGVGLALAGLEPNGGSLQQITVFNGAFRLGTMLPRVDWLFTRDGVAAAFANERHTFNDSPGRDFMGGGAMNDAFFVDGDADQVFAGGGDDVIFVSGRNDSLPLPAMDLQGGGGRDSLIISGVPGQVANVRDVFLDSVEDLRVHNGLTVRLGQAMAEGFDSLAALDVNAAISVTPDQAVLDLGLLTVLPDLGVRLIGHGRAVADQMIAHSQIATTLAGAGGGDSLTGRGGADVLEGGKGQDRLDGAGGNDTLIGGAGRDLFVFRAASDDDVVVGFRAFGRMGDRIDLTAIREVTGFRDLMREHVRVDGADLVLDLARGRTVVLEDVSRLDLDAGDFLF